MILDALMIEFESVLRDPKSKDEDLRVTYEAFFIYAGMWAVGGCFGGG
jgi:hypothetical protein